MKSYCGSAFILLFLLLFFSPHNLKSEEATSADNNPPSQMDSFPGEMSDIHDIHPLILYNEISNSVLFVIICLVLLALLLAGIFVYRNKRNRNKEMIAIKILPEDKARRALDLISDIRSITAKKFYFELSIIIRRYIEDRFGLGAVEMTTEELVPRIKFFDLKENIKLELRNLLLFSDPIKYAGEEASEERMRMDLDFVYSFIEQTTITAVDEKNKNA